MIIISGRFSLEIYQFIKVLSVLINILGGETDYGEDGLAAQLDEPLRPGGGKKEIKGKTYWWGEAKTQLLLQLSFTL